MGKENGRTDKTERNENTNEKNDKTESGNTKNRKNTNGKNPGGAKNGKAFTIAVTVLIFLIAVVIGVSVFMFIKQRKMQKELQNRKHELQSLISEYAQKALQYKEIDFSKILIYGNNSTDPEKDCMIIYFLKGTAMLRFSGLDKISIDYANTDYVNNDLRLVYKIPKNATELPIDVEISFDENKCRLVENINAEPLSDGKIGKYIEIASLAVGGSIGGAVGNAAGGLFGMKGKVIGTLAGTAVGGTGAYLFSSNYCKKTTLVKENNAETVVDLFEEAQSIVAAQLLYDDYLAGKKGAQTEKDYIQQQIANILADIIISDKSHPDISLWKSVSVSFVEEDEAGGME